MKNNTIVAASDMAYAWGVWLLIASIRKAGMDEPILIGTYGWNENWIKNICKFDNVKTIALPVEDKRCVTCTKPDIILKAETDFITWIDCDGILTGNMSELLFDPDTNVIYVRARVPAESRELYSNERKKADTTQVKIPLPLEYSKQQSADNPAYTVPSNILAIWQKDVGERAEPRQIYPFSACLLSIHRQNFPFIEKWRKQMLKVLPSDVGIVQDSSIAYFQTDESVLNSLLLFAEDAPDFPARYMADKLNLPHFVHFAYNPKPWIMWNNRSLKYFDKTMDIIEWAYNNGLGVDGVPLPPSFKRKNKFIYTALSPLARYIYKALKLKRKYLKK